MSSDASSDIVEFVQQREEWGRQKSVREAVRETIRSCAERLTPPRTPADYQFVATATETVLHPLLVGDRFPEEWADRVGEREKWDWGAYCELEDYVTNPDTSFSDIVASDISGVDTRELSAVSQIENEGVIIRAYQSLVAIAEHQGIVQDEFSPEADVYGHRLQVGVIKEPLDRDSPDMIRITDPASHPPVSVFQGLPGFGKTTAIGTEIEDRIAAGKKVIDVVDLSEFENALLDVPQSQQELREVREELGLPVDFRDADDYDCPDVEVLVPLTDSLVESRVPFCCDDGEAVVRPFTIPAAAIPREALNLMLSHLTEVQQMYLDRAYQAVDEQADWSLRDLADAVLATDAQDGVKRRIYNTLATLQGLGFIRTHECGHAIDWERIFRDTDAVTAFSQAFIQDGAHKFMVLSYLIHSLYNERQHYSSLPPLAAVFRELHHVAPNDRAMRQDEREAEIQRGMIANFQELCSMHRHEDIEVIADTQQLTGQINKRAREHVERVITFRSQMGNLKPLFKSMVGLDGERHGYMTTIARDFDVGQAAAIGYTGTDRSLEMPIEMAPPMSHHLDAQSNYDDGSHARVSLLDEYDDLPDEELRPAPWDSTLPDWLAFDELEIAEEKPATIVEDFAEECIREASGEHIKLRTVVDALESFAEERDANEGVPPKKSIGMRLRNQFDNFESDRKWNTEIEAQERVYLGLEFTPEVQKYR